MNSEIEKILKSVQEKYRLDRYKAKRAIISAPFGQKYFDEGIKKLSSSKALAELTTEGSIIIIVFTSKKTSINELPKWIHCIQVEDILNWPTHPIYQNRFFKWAIPFLFPNIKTSLYLDSDLFITQKKDKIIRIFEEIEKNEFLVTKHNLRSGWQDEYNAITKHKYLNFEKLNEQREFFIKEKMAQNFKVFQNKIISRVHDSELSILSSEVLNQLLKFSERDQLALSYACYKHQKFPFASNEGEFLVPFKNNCQINFKNIAFADPVEVDKSHAPLAFESFPQFAFLWNLSLLKLKLLKKTITSLFLNH